MVLKKILPKGLIDFYIVNFNSNKWVGRFDSWDSALKESIGYDDNKIFEKVLNSSKKVIEREAIYERDSILFYEKNYNFNFLTSCMLLRNKKSINILDFGGSFGSLYFQHKEVLEKFFKIKWSIVEQKKFVDAGKKIFESDVLKFYESIESCTSKNKIDLVILSSVLQYLPNYKDIINKIIKSNCKVIYIDRTPVTHEESFICIQKVNPKIYAATYPCHIFNETELLEKFNTKYDVIISFENNDYINLNNSKFKGYILTKSEKNE